ncbi:MAG: glutamine--fructose-6-phosphate aminotransferase [Candidatus Terrybacteria bacterium RIFCSPLOWO2_01_FULL_44_24]|uniref:Glutamine--fructose-6-phosphate aminotransferase [isomerizing] n=1 Tax=Candidatus Terrybacteria bacterium RIFCSPHIGHO2_01_FULL_43_35 TaxID=1802361 RepID=A0A1G2PE76_9BACT|nr:MAG: glutamine--fructose-6-phosphate aminotransferase [Candidatus Terrybacteria bacterium RIFCSPHIGHO2_01_FULL_43_35]OHA50830.1 MAG: glutamine--fructose-6-phosphate aminotransferase [Candidatus Terrybacteria bacterium RIFCSPLOWO2_01_FULL_44_24]
MCGIVGYIGNKQATPIVMDGLKRLEYRGYDSAGIAVHNIGEPIKFLKNAGRVAKLESEVNKSVPLGTVAIGHTRWATHGVPNDINAHPHTDCTGKIFIVHNGIIENYIPIKNELMASGHKFSSDTDTEVLAHLIESLFRGTLEDAIAQALARVRGTYALAVISEGDPQKIVAARNSSPLLIGIGDGETLLASDPSAVIAATKKVIFIEDGEMATLTSEGFRIKDLGGEDLVKRLVEIPWTLEEAEKSGHPHFMHKEIFEGPEVIQNTMRGRVMADQGLVKLGGLEDIAKRLSETNRIILTGMGTAYHAALIGEYLFEELAGVPCEVEYAAEFRYRNPILNDRSHTVLIAVSQSGETADTLAAVREAKRRNVLTMGIVNVVGSSVARETDAGIYNHAGPEIAVASTKAFLSQLIVLNMLAVFMGRMRNLEVSRAKELLNELITIPEKINQILAQEQFFAQLANWLKDAEHIFFLGRKYNFPVALEGALKLKEVSYLHAEGYNAAEMKHGPIALIDSSFPTIAIVPQDSVYEKTISNLEEIKARGGPILAIATEGDEHILKVADTAIFIPKVLEPLSPILTTVPLHLLAYHTAVARGCDVDKPRNLAKSVTVE